MANVQYHSLRISDELGQEDKPFLGDDTTFFDRTKGPSFSSKYISKWSQILAAILYTLSAVMVIWSSNFPTTWQCIQKMSTWSPMMEAVEYEWQTWDLDRPSQYTGKPTTEMEAEWDHLWQYGSLGIPEFKLPLLNKSIDQKWLYTPPELGGGVTALFEGFHQIHCLNLIRQYTYRDEYNYDGIPAFDKSPAMLLDHVEHCIEYLRVTIMCSADETPYLIMVDSDGSEVVQTNSLHRCHNFQRLIDWANDHIVEPYNATLELIKHADAHYENNSSVHSK